MLRRGNHGGASTMKSSFTLCVLAGAVLVANGAEAHFKLEQPADALMTNATGDPNGGNQKTAPCGTGAMASGIVTKVKAGSKLHIKLTETVAHGGHYRVALSNNK